MKRILSAVTSLTMGISILTSAFAVPFSTYAVSEASSFAEQSVITANDKVAAKNASSADALQWSIDNVKQASYKAGDVIYVDVFVTNAWGTDPDKEGIRGLQAFIDYDKSAFELVEIGESCYGATESSIASAGITVTLSNSTGLGTIAEKGDTVTYFGFKVKSGAKDGTYPITWVKDDTVVTIHPGGGDDNVPPTLADVDLVDGSITLGSGGSVVTTTAKTTTKPDTPSTGKLQWSLTDVTKDTYKAGDVIYVDAFVTNAWGSDPDKEGIRGLQAFIDYDKSTFELVEIGDSCYGAVESSTGSAGITVTLSNSTGLGTIAKKGDTVTYFGFKVKDGAKDGTYPITWVKDDTVVTIHPGGGDDNVPPTLADVDLVDGSITLGSGGSVVTTTAKTTTKATTTKPNTPVGDKLQWSIGNEKYTDDMGSDIVYVPVNVTRAWGTDPDTQGIRGLQGSISYDETALELVEISASSCYGNAMVNLDEKMFITTFSNASGLGTIAKQGDEVTYFGFKIKSGAKPGVYPIKWDTSYTSATIHPGGGDDNVPPTLAELDLVDGSIEIVSSVTPGVTTTAVTQSGEIGWVIPTVTAKPGDTVTMDVTVDGTDVAVAGYEGGIAHAAGVDYAGVASGSAYDAEMVDNGESLLAFATPSGLNKKAADGSTVFTLKYTVPENCKAGKYPITWANAWIVDENGNDITSLINLVDGAIIIEDATTTAVTQSGEIGWIIPTVTAKPGDTVTMDVTVDGTDVAVAGYEGGIAHAAGVDYAGVASGSAYDAEMVDNGESLLAFATPSGLNKKAADGSTVFTLKYTVPENCKAGKYPITWENAFIVDENGNDITSLINLIDGAIIIEDVVTTASQSSVTATTTTTAATSSTADTSTTAATTTKGSSTTTAATTVSQSGSTATTTSYDIPDGEIGWVIPTVTAKPGDTVKMNVFVEGTDVAVAGYEGAIAHAAGVDYAGVASGDAYGAEMIDNGEKLLAFATPDGLNKIAAEKATVFTLTYNVPDDCKAGKYPITWENAFIVDENGNDITSLINLIDGAIIIEDVVTTASQSSVTATTTTTAATSSTADTSTTAATTTKGSSTTTAAATSSVVSTTTVTATTPQNSSTTTTAKTTSGVVSTTTAATTSNGGSATTTGIVIPADAIGWIIPTVTAAPGQTVSMNVYVKGNAVGVAGMEGAVNWTSPIGFSGISDRSEAYDADVIYNPEENLIAFGRANGLNKIAEDGSYVFTLTYTVPEDCASGKYPITWDTANTFISDENGNKVPVVLVDGAIIVTPKTTTQQDGSTTTAATTSSVVSSTTAATTSSVVSTTTAATTSSVVSTTTAATTTSDVVSSTTAATTTPSVVSSTTITTTPSVVSSTTAATTTPGVVSTTPAATTSQGGSVTTTAISIPTDTIGWVIPTVTAVPGQTVTMNVYVKGSSVGVAGMEGIINWTSPIGFSGISDRSEAYDADVVYNPEENIIAFGRNSGLNKIAEDGSYVFTLTYTVPEDCESGIYPVSWDSAKTYISDENGNKVPVVLIDGAIIVSPKTTTATTPQGGSTTTVTATTPQGGSTTTVTETTPQGGSTTTVTATTPQSGSTTTASATTPQGGSTTTASATTPQGGSTTTASATTPQGGSTTTASATTPQGGSTTTASATTPQGGSTTTVTVTTPQGGSTTTTTGPVSPGTGTATSMIGFFAIDSEIETTYGFYFSHDTNEFNKGQIIKVIAHCTFQKEDGTIEESDVDLTADIGFNGQTPYSMFKKSLGNVYEVPLYYGDEPLTYEDGSPVTVLALIGVKGDADLNNTVDAIDASNVLTYYAQKQTGVESPVLYQGPTDVLKGVNEKFGNVIKGLDQVDVLDELACFLADVDVDEYSSDNWKTHKGNRAIDAIDASNILSFYAKVQTGSPADSATWDEVLGR